jgi:hypothetical protein
MRKFLLQTAFFVNSARAFDCNQGYHRLWRWAVVFCFLVAADAVAAVLTTIAAQSASFVQIAIFVSWFVGGHRCSVSGRIDARASHAAPPNRLV